MHINVYLYYKSMYKDETRGGVNQYIFCILVDKMIFS